MSTLDDPVTRELTEEYLTLMEQADKFAAQAKEVAALLLARIPAGQALEIVPGVGVKVQAPSRRFNEDVARELLTEDEFMSICEPVPSVKLARKLLPGAIVDAMCPATGAPSLRRL